MGQPVPDKRGLEMIRPLSVAVWLLSYLVVTSTALAKDKPKPYEKSFDLKVLGTSIGQVIVSFEDRIKPGKTTVDVSASLSSPSGSVFPAGVSPYSLPLLPGTGIAVPGISLPVYITIKTAAGFRGPAKVGLHLEVLEYNPSLPLRLFVSDGTLGSLFKDITAYQGPGSMYTSGYRDAFSEFVIAWDGRSLADVINSKFGDIDSYLSTNSNLIAPDRYQDLRDRLEDALQAYYWQGDAQESIDDLEQFIDSVRTAIALNEMPATFNDPLNPYPNVAGGLIMRSETTVFSLGLLR